MSKNIQVGTKGGLVSAAMYFVVGLLIYLWLGTYTVFAWSDPWLYVYMVFWPLILIWNVIIWAVIIFLIIFVIVWIVEH